MDRLLPPLAADAHKYSRGVVGVIAGSVAYPGAAVLAVGGARRGGAGYVRFWDHTDAVTSMVLAAYPDVVAVREVDATTHCWVIGPGSPEVTPDVDAAVPVVLDGSAMARAHDRRHGLTVITPHEGEARALGYRVEDRMATARTMAHDLGVVVVLKGPRTIVIEPDGHHHIDALGGPELATAGTGDILAGLLGSMIAAWRPADPVALVDVAARAVRAHALAGREAARHARSVVATDVLAALPGVLAADWSS